MKGLYGIARVRPSSARRGGKTLFVCSEDALDYIVRPRFQAAVCDAELAFALSIDDPAGEQVPHLLRPVRLLYTGDRGGGRAEDSWWSSPIASYIDAGLDMGKNNEMRADLAARSSSSLAPPTSQSSIHRLPPRQEP